MMPPLGSSPKNSGKAPLVQAAVLPFQYHVGLVVVPSAFLVVTTAPN